MRISKSRSPIATSGARSARRWLATCSIVLTELFPRTTSTRSARPDLSVDGTVEIERLEDVLYLDRPAYGQAESLVGLYVIEPQTQIATITQVRLGRTSVNTVEIVDGLVVGEEVILSDSSQWGDDARIRLVE